MEPVIFQIYCSWHIDKAWQCNLSKIIDKEKRTTVYKTLKTLQQHSDIFVFKTSLNNFISMLISEPDTVKFGQYFRESYANNFKQWAYCFRCDAGINTNMRLESFHKIIKYFYCDGKNVKRLDKSLHMLLKYVRDKDVERLTKQTKGKYTLHTKKIIERHNFALNYNFLIKNIDQNPTQKQSIDPADNSEVAIVQTNSKDTCCNLICQHCQICWHNVYMHLCRLYNAKCYL